MGKIMLQMRVGQLLLQADLTFFAMLAMLFSGTREGMLIWALSACVLHELGHLLMMVLQKQQVQQIHFTGAGIRIQPQHILYSYHSDQLVLLAGPMGNLICCGFLFYLGKKDAAQIHLVLGAMNLLPFPELDGGGLLQNFCRVHRVPERWIFVGQTVLCVIVCLAAGIAGIWYGITNLTFYILLLYLLYAAVPWKARGNQ